MRCSWNTENPNAATKKAPPEMLMGRRIRTALDAARTDSTGKQMDEYRVPTTEWYPPRVQGRESGLHKELRR